MKTSEAVSPMMLSQTEKLLRSCEHALYVCLPNQLASFKHGVLWVKHWRRGLLSSSFHEHINITH